MRFGIIGCGYIARVHLTAMKKVPGAQPVAVIDQDEKSARDLAAEFGLVKVYTDWQEAFQVDEFEAAVLCLPHQLHFPCGMDALNAGKHILMEKPIAITMEQARSLSALARQKNLTLMVGHMKRFDRRFALMKEKIDDGSLGKVFLAKSEWIGPKEVFEMLPWVAKAVNGGGPLMGFGSHHLDLLQWMLGPVSKVACYTNHLAVPVEVEDTAVAILQFESGAVANITYTWGAEIYGQSENLVLYGTCGTLNLNNEELLHICEAVYGDRTPRPLDVRRSEQQEIEEFGKELALSSLEPFILEQKHFIESIENKRPVSIDGEEASKALAIITAAYNSANQK